VRHCGRFSEKMIEESTRRRSGRRVPMDYLSIFKNYITH
jgi:hypothetical protein